MASTRLIWSLTFHNYICVSEVGWCHGHPRIHATVLWHGWISLLQVCHASQATAQHDMITAFLHLLHFGAFFQQGQHGLSHLTDQTGHQKMLRSQTEYKHHLLHAVQFSSTSDYDLHDHVWLVQSQGPPPQHTDVGKNLLLLAVVL